MLLIVLIFVREILGDWVHVSTPLYRVRSSESTELLPVSAGIEFSDEFSCARIHNLTAMGYSKPTFQDSFNFEYENNQFLEKLEARLQSQIENRIKELGLSRKSRTYHIGFPSLEGALVSISLLLFAVYLIKLVMKVLYTFGAKKGTTEYVGFLSNLRQPIVIAPNRQKRSFQFDIESFKINNMIQEQYRLFR